MTPRPDSPSDDPVLEGNQDHATRDPFCYRADIDGLRALAVGAVVVYHMDTAWLPGGFVGVDIFFVVSGYVVTGSLLKPNPIKRDALSLRSFAASFYARRVKRLAPALVVVVFATGLLMALAAPVDERGVLSHYWLSGILGLVGTANNYFAVGGGGGVMPGDGGYFANLGLDSAASSASTKTPVLGGLKRNPFMHLWSLGVEEQFYFLYPLLVFATYLARPHRAPTTSTDVELQRLTGLTHSRQAPQTPRSVSPARWPAVHATSILLSTMLASAILSAALTYTHTNVAFFIMPSRWWQLAAGCLLFVFQAFNQRRWDRLISSPIVARMLDISATATLGVAFALTPLADGFPFPRGPLAVIGTLCFLASGAAPAFLPQSGWHWLFAPQLLSRCAALRPCVYVGQLSYPIYLWHWPLLALVSWMGWTAIWTKVVAVGVAVLLSSMTYHGPEARARAWRPSRPWHVFALLLPLVLLSELWLLLLKDPLHGKLCIRNHIDSRLTCVPSDACGGAPGTANARPCRSCYTEHPYLEPYVSPAHWQANGIASSGPLDLDCACTANQQALQVPSWATVLQTGAAYSPANATQDARLMPPCYATTCSDPALRAPGSFFCKWPMHKGETNRQNSMFVPRVGCYANGWYREVRAWRRSRGVPPDGLAEVNGVANETRNWIVEDLRYCLGECSGRIKPVQPELGPEPRAVSQLPTLFMVGDSHTANLWAGVEFALRGKYNVVVYGSYENRLFGDQFNTERAFPSVFSKELSQLLRPGDILAIAYHSGGWDPLGAKYLWRGQTRAGTREEYSRTVKKILQTIIDPAGARLLLLGDAPHFSQFNYNPQNQPPVVEPFNRISRLEADLSVHHMHSYAAAMAAAHDSVFFFDPVPHLCDAEYCYSRVGSSAYDLGYMDVDHTTDTLALYMWPWLCAFFRDSGILLHKRGHTATNTQILHKKKLG